MRRFLLLILAVGAFAQTGVMRVQRRAATVSLSLVSEKASASADGNGFSISGINRIGATCMLVLVHSYSAGTATITDAGNTTGSPVYSPTAANLMRWETYLYSLSSVSGSDSIDLAGAGTFASMYAYAFSGGACSLLAGSGKTANITGGTALALPTETISTASYAVGAISTDGNQPSGYNAATGYTIPSSTNGHNTYSFGNHYDTATAYITTSANTTLTWDWNLVSNSTANAVGIIVVVQ